MESGANNMTLKEQILEILDDGDCTVSKIDNGYMIKYGRMYDAPPLDFEKMIALSELFGTKKINFDDYAISGCETCDYYSDYGHEIYIYELGKNVEEMEKLVGQSF